MLLLGRLSKSFQAFSRSDFCIREISGRFLLSYFYKNGTTCLWYRKGISRSCCRCGGNKQILIFLQNSMVQTGETLSQSCKTTLWWRFFFFFLVTSVSTCGGKRRYSKGEKCPCADDTKLCFQLCCLVLQYPTASANLENPVYWLGDFLERYKALQYRCSIMKTCAQNNVYTSWFMSQIYESFSAELLKALVWGKYS